MENLSKYDIIFGGDIDISCNFIIIGNIYLIKDETKWDSLLSKYPDNILESKDIDKYISGDNFTINGNLYIYEKNNFSVSGCTQTNDILNL